MRFLLPLLLSSSLASAQPATPAPLNGIWQLTALTGTDRPLSVRPELVIVGGQVHGRIGCGRFEGTIQAASNRAQLHVAALPPRPEERCLFAVPGAVHHALNSVAHYVVSADTQQLVLFSKTLRLTFDRLEYVTPLKH